MLFSTPEEAAWQAEAQYEYQRRCAAANTPGLVPHPDQDNSLQMVLRQRAPQYLISHQQTIQTSWQVQDNWAALSSLQQLPSATAAASQFVLSFQQSTQPPPPLLTIESYAENIVEEFGEYYGKDVNDLGALEGLCGAFGIVPSSTIQGCIALLQNCHMNIFDVVELGGRQRKGAELFENKDEMMAYSRWTGRVWPRNVRQGNRLLRALMRHFR